MSTAGDHLREYIRTHFTSSAFRLETLQQYDPTVAGFKRYLDGEASPDKQRWLDRLRADRDAGLRRYRVRIVTPPVTDYTRYECEWGYAPNSEFEEIRIMDLREQSMPIVPWSTEHDWWLLDDQHLFSMGYDDEGKYVSGVEEGHSQVAAAIATRDVLYEAAEPFATWWARNTDLHREGRRAA